MSVSGFPGCSAGKESACSAGESGLIPGSNQEYIKYFLSSYILRIDLYILLSILYVKIYKIYKRHFIYLSWSGKIPWRRDRLPTSVFLGFPGGSDSKESACNMGDLGLILVLGRSPGGGHGNPLQHAPLENSNRLRSLTGYSLQGHKESDTTERPDAAAQSVSLFPK